MGWPYLFVRLWTTSNNNFHPLLHGVLSVQPGSHYYTAQGGAILVGCAVHGRLRGSLRKRGWLRLTQLTHA